MTNRLKVNTFAEYVCVFLTIYLSIDTLLFGTNVNAFARIALIGLTIALSFFLFVRRWVKTGHILITRKDSFTLFFMLGILVASHLKALLLLGTGIEGQYIYNYLLIVYMFELSQVLDLNEFCHKYVNIMTFLAGFAIVLYCFDIAGIAEKIPSLHMTNTAGACFYHFGFGATMEHLPYYTIRAYGIFREPGVFAIYLGIATGILLLFQKRFSLIKLLILSIAIILTFSTAGYIILLAEIAIFVIMKANSKRELYIKIAVCALLIVAIIVLEGVYDTVFGKFHVENDSLNSRVYSVISGLDFSVISPILGCGWKYISENFEATTYSKYGIANAAFTNTYLRMAATYGWIYTLFMIQRIYRLIRNGIHGRTRYFPIFFSMCVLVLWIVMFSNEGMVLNPLLYLWMLNRGTMENDHL